MNPDRTGPEPHPCTICGAIDMVPDIMPYCVGGDIKNPIHSWAHPACVFAVMEAKRKEREASGVVRMKSQPFFGEEG